MNPCLVITIDTESDAAKWQAEKNPGMENLLALPRLQKVFQKYKVRPTYLITYSVCFQSKTVQFLQELQKQNKIEIGAHLHSWETPPFNSEAEKIKMGYQYKSDLEMEKIECLTKTITDAFGKKPVSFRAGRYGVDKESFEYLEKSGYLIDTSITPNINWGFDGGPNFAGEMRLAPYFQNKILEVPLSIEVNRGMSKIAKQTYNFLPLKVKKILAMSGIVKTIWLRPSIASFEEMKWLSDSLIKRKIPVLNLMFHSNELMAGKSHYTKNKQEEERMFERLDKILDYLINQKGFASLTLGEIYNLKI